MRRQAAKEQKLPLWKKVMAGAGVITIVAGVAYTGYFVATANAGGPSEMTLHPERQDEINAQRRAEALSAELGLTPEQTEKVAGIYYHYRIDLREKEQAAAGNLTARALTRMSTMQALEGEIMAVLDEEQRAQFAQTRLDRFGKLRELRSLVQRGEIKPILPEGQRPRIFDQFLDQQPQ